MASIKQLKYNLPGGGGEEIYPISITDAISDSYGSTLTQILSGIDTDIETINSGIENKFINLLRIRGATNTTGKYIQIVIDENNAIQFQLFNNNPNRLAITVKIDGVWSDNPIDLPS